MQLPFPGTRGWQVTEPSTRHAVSVRSGSGIAGHRKEVLRGPC